MFWADFTTVPKPAGAPRRRGPFKALVLLGGGALLLLGLLGCAAPAAPTAPGAPADEKPKYGGILELATATTATDTDPHMTGCCPRWWSMASNRLIELGPYDLTINPIPAVVEKWELTDNGLGYSFQIRQGVKFHNVPPVNGRELTAQDVAFNLRRMAGMENPKGLSITNFPRSSVLSAMEDAVAVDKYTVRIKLKRRDGGFLLGVGDMRNMIVAPEVVKEYGDLRNTEKTTIGVGPFIMTKWVDRVTTEYKRNPDYWRKDKDGNKLPYLDELRYTAIGDKNTILAALRAKQLDMWSGGLPQNHEDLQKTNPDLQWHRYFGGCCSNIGPGLMVKKPPMTDLRVRKALNLLIDRRAIGEAQFGKGTYGKYWVYAAPTGAFFKDYVLSQEEISQMPGWRQPKGQDIAEAKKLLAEAGYPTGFTWIMDTNPATTGSISGDGDGCPLTQGQFKRDYVDTKVLPDMKVECFPREGPLQFKANVEFAHEMAYWWSYANEFDPGLQAHIIYACGGGRNYTQHCDDKWMQRWEAQQQELDVKKRIELMKDLQRYTLQQYWTLLVWDAYTNVSAQSYVRGMQQWIGPSAGIEANYFYDYLWKAQ